MREKRPRETGRRRIGKILERDWLDVIAEALWPIFRLTFRAIRFFFD